MMDAPRLIPLGDPSAIACEGDACLIPGSTSGSTPGSISATGHSLP